MDKNTEILSQVKNMKSVAAANHFIAHDYYSIERRLILLIILS